MPSMGRIEQLLAAALEEGRRVIGEIALAERDGGGFALCHRADLGRDDLVIASAPEAARDLATNDDAGVYRPLKTAPNLRRGWALHLPDLAAVRAALDYFYPAALALWLAQREGRLEATPFRATVDRQTGMYRVTGRITDAQALALVGDCCAPARCHRTILWEMAPGQGHAATLPAGKFDPEVDKAPAVTGPTKIMPILCAELCNLVVAEARVVVKGGRNE